MCQKQHGRLVAVIPVHDELKLEVRNCGLFLVCN
jgi:hypothetical protein